MEMLKSQECLPTTTAKMPQMFSSQEWMLTCKKLPSQMTTSSSQEWTWMGIRTLQSLRLMISTRHKKIQLRSHKIRHKIKLRLRLSSRQSTKRRNKQQPSQ